MVDDGQLLVDCLGQPVTVLSEHRFARRERSRQFDKALTIISGVPGAFVTTVHWEGSDDKSHLYAQCVSYTRSYGNPATAKGRAAHLFRDMAGAWPDGFSYERTHNVDVTRAVLGQIQRKKIAFAKARQAVPA